MEITNRINMNSLMNTLQKQFDDTKKSIEQKIYDGQRVIHELMSKIAVAIARIWRHVPNKIKIKICMMQRLSLRTGK